MPNRLAAEKSPYLLQHAGNPVDWHPWDDEALALARREDKPIFLSVGYSACHWCHVMERESFEDPAIAAVLREGFVAIKVDREERPDIDEVYMTAVQLMTGSGGWPMSVFLTPDGRPFYGGTYFPPASGHGRVGFRSLLLQLAEAWRERRSEVEGIADSMAVELKRAARQRPIAASGSDGAVDPDALLRAAVRDLQSRFDADRGGFGGAPKFPPHHALRLLALCVRRGIRVDSTKEMLGVTLEKMALGGLYDHVGGGFHRYSTDAIWLVPHFEKMLYDSALLARTCADAAAPLGKPALGRVARETCDWMLRDLLHEAGGLYSALDADSEGEEGKYYVWSRTEAESAAGRSFCDAYQIASAGNWRDEASGRASGTNIPHLNGEEALPDALDPEILAARGKLLDVRARRVPPMRDEKILTAWNGLAIGALSVAGKNLGEPRYLEAARLAAEFCLGTLRPEGRLLHRWARGDAAIDGFLDDYAYLADGLLDLFDATGEVRWRDEAQSLAIEMVERFWDDEDGGFFFASDRHEALVARSKDLFDGALPSANGVAARALARLGGRFAAHARSLLLAYHGVLLRAPHGTATLIGAAVEAFPQSLPEVSLHAPHALRLAPGGSAEIRFALEISPGWHVESPAATLSSDLPAALGPVEIPKGERLEGHAEFVVPVLVSPGAAPGNYTLALSAHCQPCSDDHCLAPRTVEASATVRVEGRPN